MAEEKKDAKPAAKPADKAAGIEQDEFVEIIWLILTLLIGFYILQRLLALINSFIAGKGPIWGIIKSYLSWLLLLIPFVKILIVIMCVALAYFIYYLYKELSGLRENERKQLYPEIINKNIVTNPHWERILTHIESLNENDWRLAIIEADIMLSGILDRLYLPGDTIAEKLKAVEKSDFNSIDYAWEAHKIRNQIAHEGQSFVMTQREGRRVIGLYQKVFEEFQVI
jgi:hypothetical protein